MDRNVVLARLKEEINTKLEQYNAAVAKGDMTAIALADEGLRANLEEYNNNILLGVYDSLHQKENPIIAAAMLRSVNGLWFRDIKENGILTGRELRVREIDIDLLHFARKSGYKTDWRFDVECLNLLLCLRVAKEIGLSEQKMKEIHKSYFMSKNAQSISNGQTPISNTQLVGRLQDVVNKIFGVDGYKVNNHDLAYILACYTRRGKAALTVKAANHSLLRSLVYDVCHRVSTGKVYDLEYKKLESKNQSPVTVIPAATVQAEASTEIAVEPQAAA